MASAVRIENWADIRELVLMSIGTDKGRWFADPEFGSELWLLKKSGKTDGQSADTLKRMVLESLQWLVADGLAQSVHCDATPSGKNKIEYTVTVTRPDGPTVIIKEVWDAI
ncbi:MAG: phage GP46 family protein [Treponema sp.]|nr:phage GP46 family protein [Treponema sp.]